MSKHKKNRTPPSQTTLGMITRAILNGSFLNKAGDRNQGHLRELPEDERAGIETELLELCSLARTVIVEPKQIVSIAPSEAVVHEMKYAQTVPDPPFQVTAYDFCPEGVGIIFESTTVRVFGVLVAEWGERENNNHSMVAITIWGIDGDSQRSAILDDVYQMLEDWRFGEHNPEFHIKEITLAIIFGMSMFVECLHVELQERDPFPPAHRAAGQPRYEVVVRTGKRKAYRQREDHGSIDYSHRFERRGHFKHHWELTPEGKTNPIFAAAQRDKPEKIIQVDGRPCVRIWTPSTVVGPEDKPLIIKRRVVRSQQPAERTQT